jgi:DNA-directed RNA polymerase beta subunit
VTGGKVTTEVKYLSAIEEAKYHIAQANVALTKDGKFADELVLVRKQGDVLQVAWKLLLRVTRAPPSQHAARVSWTRWTPSAS